MTDPSALARVKNAAPICLARRRIDVLHAMLRDRALYQAPTAHPGARAA